MELSCNSEYAFLALIFLRNRSLAADLVKIREIAMQKTLVDRYLEPLLVIVRHLGLLRSQRGVRGRDALARNLWQIALLEVINCTEGRDIATPAREPVETAEVAFREVWQ